MNKKKNLFFILVILIGMAAGTMWKPQESKAAPPFTVNVPALNIPFEFVDNKGNDFPIPMGLEATHVTAKGWYSASTLEKPTVFLSATPLSITKTSGKNVFTLTEPPLNMTLTVLSEMYFEYISNIKINSPLPYIKEISLEPPSGSSLPKKDGLRKNGDMLGFGGGPTGVNLNGRLEISKNPDDTYNIKAIYPDWSLNGYSSTLVGQREMRTSSLYNTYAYYGLSAQNNAIRFYVYYYQVKELFEDETGAMIPAPSGYTNDNAVDVTTQPFSYQMTNDSSLPKTYTDSGNIYTYEGWYRGAGNKSSMITTYPPSINFNADLNEPGNEVHIVYNKKTLRMVDEEYINISGTTIESSWNNMGQQKADGDTLTQTPATTKTDSSGADWEYQGWKLGSEPMSAMRPASTPVSVLIDANKTVQYVYKKVEHTITEKWVDQSDGTTLVTITGNPKTNTVDDNDSFTGSATSTITDSTGALWDFVGWENVTDAAGTVVPAASPLAIANVKGNKEVRYHYQARNTTATFDLKPTPQVISSGSTVAWSSRLTNTGNSTLNNLKLKATSNWASGLSDPVQVTVIPAGGSAQNFTLSSGDWATGFNLTGINIPNVGPNNYADITFSTIATGAVNQVLPAEIEIDGNMASPLTAENFVRIDDPDEPNLEPTGNAGLINIPDFRFGEVEVKPYAQKKGLDTASYQSGYNPYIRYMDKESTGIYSLSVKMSPFTSGSKTLPSTTSIRLKNGMVKEVQNYNKHNESLSGGSSIGDMIIKSDNTTSFLHFSNTQGVYQLDYAFNDVELELMAHSGVAGLSYTADMDWTLTTAP